jgi:tetratricopeptide (TPR) repeat protein
MRVPPITLLVAAAFLVFTASAAGDTWYEHYANAEQALEGEKWEKAVEELNEALKRKADSGARIRSYGMNVIAYYPYFKLGVAYYHLGQFDAALQAFETETRLGAIRESDTADTELDRYRELASESRTAAAVEQQRRVRQTVADSLGEAERLKAEGRLVDAMEAADRALAVAPDDTAALAVMRALREQFAAQRRQLAEDSRVERLLDEADTLLADERFSEAASLYRQALALRPDPGVEALLERAQRGLLGSFDASALAGDLEFVAAETLAEVLRLESQGDIADALNRMQALLAVRQDDSELQAIQARLIRARDTAQAERERQDAIRHLLAEAAAEVDDGSMEAALSAANRVLALDPANSEALRYVADAYGVLSRELLGSQPQTAIPPAVRFVDLREEQQGGLFAQLVRTPAFRLDGIVIDDSPVELQIFADEEQPLDIRFESQPLGNLYVGEFHMEADLAPGATSFFLLATDEDDVRSGSEYTVIYLRPVFRAPWFYALLLAVSVILSVTALWQRNRRLLALRQRRYNPYVAGAPILDEEMFFGRRELVDRILQTIHNNSLLIFGERRIGKTSIQHQVKKRLRELDDPKYDFKPVYVDLQGTPQTGFFRTIAEDIFEQLAPSLRGLEPATEFDDAYDFRDFVRDVRAVLKTLQEQTEKTVKLVMLIDEVDELNDYDPRINQKLRSLFMKNFAENLVAVVSGVEIKKRWEREGSPWYNFFEEIEVRPFDPAEARELIERPVGGMFRLEKASSTKYTH